MSDDNDPIERPEESSSATLTGPHGEYTVTASTLHLKDPDGKERASIFSVAYVLGEGDAARPVTFCFNGGPGSSSVWLQFGVFGPRRVAMPDLSVAPGPFPLVDNPHSLLAHSDLVFIDPVGTGFSRHSGTAEAKEFHTVQGDIDSVAEFIWRWLSRNGRWSSPRFLAGESYGTTRAGGLSLKLQNLGIPVTGLILVSVALSFQTFVETPTNDLPFVLALPTYVATAAYHGIVHTDDLDALLDEARRFAIEEYAPALLLGARLTDERRQHIAQRLSELTGLPVQGILRHHNRIPMAWFSRTVLGPGERTVGRLDSRYVGVDLDPTGTRQTRDPSLDGAMGSYTGAANDFLRREVGWASELPYEVLSLDVNKGWSWEREGHMGFTDTTEDLRRAMVMNPALQVLFANGLYDLATPFFAAEHTAGHLALGDGAADRLHLTYYPAGHMMYFHGPSLAQLSEDVAAFLRDALDG